MADHRIRPLATALSLGRRAAVALLIGASVVYPAAVATARSARHAASQGRQHSLRIPASPSAPIAAAPRLVQAPGRATLSFDLSRSVPASAFVLADPGRVVVDLPEVNFQVDAAAGMLPHGAPGDLVAAYRVGIFAAGRSRIVIDLRAPAKLVKVDTVAPAKGRPTQLVIELARVDAAAFRQAAARGAREEAARAAQRAAAVAALPKPDVARRTVVVLDPGHGGIDPGASGAGGVVEKDVVLEFARVLAAKLEAGGRYKVLMTRTSDMFVSLGDRLKLARAAHAALLVSIHCDALAGSPEVSGTTVYTVSSRASDAEAARIAESENKADLAGGIDTKNEDANDVADILFDFTRRETRTFGHVFARTLVNYLKASTRLNYNPQRSAGFWVLKAPDVPSVLIELGYLSSRADVEQLTSAAWREKTALAMVKAINNVFAADREPGDHTATVSARPRPPEIAGSVWRGSLLGEPDAPH